VDCGEVEKTTAGNGKDAENQTSWKGVEFSYTMFVCVTFHPVMSKSASSVVPQYLAATAANLATVTAGCSLGWASPALPKITAGSAENEGWLALTTEENAWVSALMSVGAALGPLITAYTADKIGRRWSLLATAPIAIAGWLIIGFAESFALLLVARLILGIGVGMVFAVTPMYCGEIAEDRIRGALGSFLQLLVCVGILFEYCIGPYIDYNVLAFVTVTIPIAFAVSFFFFPESPYYLLQVGKTEEATKSLMWFRRQSRDDVQEELKEMQVSVDEMLRNKGSVTDLVKTKGNRWALCYSMELVAGQQLCGINAVLFNSQTIFTATGGSLAGAEATIIIGSVMVLASGVTPLVVDRLGRKLLLHISATGMVIGLVVLGVFFYLKNHGEDVSNIGVLPILSLVLYISVYSIGYGPLPWAVLGELFPSNVKSNASSCTASFCWLISFFITRFYTDITTGLGGSEYTFWLFAAFAFASALFVFFLLPETKGKSLQEIQELLNK
ncbi:hypothetical protein L9F63_023369, partial [Diploptera punctata]